MSLALWEQLPVQLAKFPSNEVGIACGQRPGQLVIDASRSCQPGRIDQSYVFPTSQIFRV